MPAPLLYNTLLDRGFEIIPVTDELMSYIITGILEDNKKRKILFLESYKILTKIKSSHILLRLD